MRRNPRKLTPVPNRKKNIERPDAETPSAGALAQIVSIPVQRVFPPRQAAQYLGVHPQTLKKLTDEGKLPARWMRNRRAYLLEELECYVQSLPDYNQSRGEYPGQKGNN